MGRKANKVGLEEGGKAGKAGKAGLEMDRKAKKVWLEKVDRQERLGWKKKWLGWKSRARKE